MSLIISIDGNIGVGKSLFLDLLKNEIIKKKIENVVFLEEPVDEWSKISVDGITILEKFYSETEKYAFSFQIMTFISRLNNILNCIDKNPNAIIISERSLLTDKYIFAKMLHDDNKIDSYSYQIYNLLFENFISKLPKHKYIYLYCNPNIALQRIKKRNRIGENINLDYLTNCNKYHENLFNKNENVIFFANIGNINIYSNNLNDSTNVLYKILINNVINTIINQQNNKIKINKNLFLITDIFKLLINILILIIYYYLIYIYIL